MISDHGLLFIEPEQTATPTPVIDRITRKLCAAFRQARDSDWASGGFHQCCCGAMSEDHDFHLPNGDLTNSLCVHYVAHHRSEVPQQQLARIDSFTSGEVEPTWEELHDPHPILPELPEEVRQAVTEVEAEIEALDKDFNAAVADQDWERAVEIRRQTRKHNGELEEKLRKKKGGIIREWRNGYLVEHFATLTDLWIQMKWGVYLVYAGGASPAIVKFLRTALKSTGVSKTLSDRMGSRFDAFMRLLNACEAE
jgi:glutathione S-transferase